MARLRISGRRLKIKDRRGRFFLFVVLMGLMLIPINAAYDASLPLVLGAADARAMSAVGEAIEQCAAECGIGDSAVVEYDPSGAIRGVRTDVAEINRIRADFSAALVRKLEKSAVRIPVHIGDIIGSPATAGRGPCIVVRMTGYSAYAAEVESSIESAGVNQSLYTTYMTVTVRGTLILPRRELRDFEYVTKIPLAETLIVGGVPNYYGGY